MASQPAFLLWPSTIQNGFDASSTRTVIDVESCFSTRTLGLADAGLLSAVATISGTDAAAPPAAEVSTTRSKSTPLTGPFIVRSRCLPDESLIASPGSQSARVSDPWETAAADVPLMRTGKGAPSIVTRSARQVAGISAGATAGATPGIPSSAIAAGITLRESVW